MTCVIYYEFGGCAFSISGELEDLVFGCVFLRKTDWFVTRADIWSDVLLENRAQTETRALHKCNNPQVTLRFTNLRSRNFIIPRQLLETCNVSSRANTEEIRDASRS